MGVHVSRVLGGAALAAVLAGCTGAPTTTQPAAPPTTAPSARSWDDIPYSSPAGGATIDFAVDGFDPCSPFTSTLWLKMAAIDPQLDPQAVPEPGGGCRWRSPGMTATVAVETGRSLRDYNADPRYRPGERGSAGNPYWRTAASTESRECHAFLAVGPARPDTVVHVTVQNDEVEAPLSGGGKAHSCVFTETLVEATSLVLENPPATAAPAT
jgi:hypothetical protein